MSAFPDNRNLSIGTNSAVRLSELWSGVRIAWDPSRLEPGELTPFEREGRAPLRTGVHGRWCHAGSEGARVFVVRSLGPVPGGGMSLGDRALHRSAASPPRAGS